MGLGKNKNMKIKSQHNSFAHGIWRDEEWKKILNDIFLSGLCIKQTKRLISHYKVTMKNFLQHETVILLNKKNFTSNK